MLAIVFAVSLCNANKKKEGFSVYRVALCLDLL